MKYITMNWEKAQESNIYAFFNATLERGKEPISDEHLPLDVVQYEIEHLPCTRKNNREGIFCEHGLRADEREIRKAHHDCR